MTLSLNTTEKGKIQERYDTALKKYPCKREEVESWLKDKPEEFVLCMKSIYGHLHINDLISRDPELFDIYITSALRAYESIPYAGEVPTEIFLSYVLPPRVNNEWLDGSREYLQRELLPYIHPEDMTESILDINLWCFGRAIYMPSNERTLAPFGMMNSAAGRCGEESTFVVCALRSVGIPARQVYVPRWSHCDDNHAWVEVWVDGVWHYLGACEPSDELDNSWFTAAASKAMLIYARRWNSPGTEKGFFYKDGLTLVANTRMYAPVKKLQIYVTDNGTALQGCTVRFQILNYSELFTLYETHTGRDGKAEFETGLGDCCVSISNGKKYLLTKVDLRTQEVLSVDLKDMIPYSKTDGLIVRLDLVPPMEKATVANHHLPEAFISKLSKSEENRKGITKSFYKNEALDPFGKYREYAKGNRSTLEEFLEDPAYSEHDKLLLLDTLESKDFTDLQRGVLCDALENALPFKGQFTEDIYQRYILAPRVENEMLLPVRGELRKRIQVSFGNPKEILDWMNSNMAVCMAGGSTNFLPSVLGCVRSGVIPSSAYEYAFVVLCRTFGFPARLHKATKSAEWLDHSGKWIAMIPAQRKTTKLTLMNPSGESLNYFEHFSIAVLQGDRFHTLDFSGLVLRDRILFTLPTGYYRLIITTRQIDGTASAVIYHINLNDEKKLQVKLPEDRTAEKLKAEPLHHIRNHILKDILSRNIGRESVLIFASPGEEPTEHLLQEMLECRDSFSEQRIVTDILISKPEAGENKTLQAIAAEVPEVHILVNRDEALQAVLQDVMKTGDRRLPFVIVIDQQGRGVYASANYNIREAQILLKITNILKYCKCSDNYKN